MPNKKAACARCVNWVKGEESMGQCRRHAPRPRDRDWRGDRPWLWPLTRATDWCGEFEQRTRVPSGP